MIHRCALAVITERGRNVVPASVAPLDPEEEDFLARHVAKLRKATKATDARGRFRQGSTLQNDFEKALVANDDELVSIADTLVDQLASAMRSVSNASSCVVALVVSGPRSQPTNVSLLKLDAEIEAARLDQTRGGVRLRVFKDLLPSPGDLQKGISWPDPRAPHSELIVIDRVKAGTAVRYFQTAYRIDVSPRAVDTEKMLVEEIAALPQGQIAAAVAAAQDGGDAEAVVARIQQSVSTFAPTATELGAGGALGGQIRPNFVAAAKLEFSADGIDLHVPVDRLDRVSTRRVGTAYVTTVRTSTPLTPAEEELS